MLHVLKRDIILLLPQPTHSFPAPISCPGFYLVTPVTHPSAQGSEPLNAVLNPAVQHEISHASVISALIYTTAPVVSESRTTGSSVYERETDNVRKKREEREREMGKRTMMCVRVETQMTDRNAEKLPAIKTSAVMTAV